jgi:hypothetical protein
MGILPNVQHAATSTIKIGILINYFRYQVTAPPDDVKMLLATAVICSQNSAANDLMLISSGNGTIIEGLRRTTDTMCKAGAVNSAIRSNLWIGPQETLNVPDYYVSVATTPCPGAAYEGSTLDQSVSANSGNQNITTAADMGTLLMMIYDCAYYGSGLMTVFPDEITQTECQQMLEILHGTRFKRLAELGAPQDVRLAHKVGYADETVADAGVVFSPGGDYIFVMYVWEPDTDGNGLTNLDKWDLIADVSRIVYNYFNPDQPLQQTRPSVNPLGGAACVIPFSPTDINLSDIDAGRFDAQGNPLPTACYDWPNCRAFDNWGQ